MENQNLLLRADAGSAGDGLAGKRTKEILLERLCSVDVDSSGDMTTIVLVVEAAVDHEERVDLRRVLAVKEIIKLRLKSALMQKWRGT